MFCFVLREYRPAGVSSNVRYYGEKSEGSCLYKAMGETGVE